MLGLRSAVRQRSGDLFPWFILLIHPIRVGLRAKNLVDISFSRKHPRSGTRCVGAFHRAGLQRQGHEIKTLTGKWIVSRRQQISPSVGRTPAEGAQQEEHVHERH